MDGNRQPFSLAVLSEPFIASMQLYGCLVTVPWLRLLRGPLQPGWSLEFELANTFAKARMNHVFDSSGVHDEHVAEARARDRMVVPFSPALLQMPVVETTAGPVPGRWFEPANPVADMLYLRGGAYAYRPLLHDQFVVFLADSPVVTLNTNYGPPAKKENTFGILVLDGAVKDSPPGGSQE